MFKNQEGPQWFLSSYFAKPFEKVNTLIPNQTCKNPMQPWYRFLLCNKSDSFQRIFMTFYDKK